MAIVQYVLGLTLVVVTTFVLYFKWNYGYWKRRNVPYIEPKMPIGNFQNILFASKSFDDILEDLHREVKSKGKGFGGIFILSKPTLLMIDPDLIKSMFGKDFQHFVNRGFFFDEKNDPLAANLLGLTDDKWKNMRNTLSPTFTSGKLKIMFDAMVNCGDQLIDHVSDLSSKKKPLAVDEVISSFGIDVIGTCAFGIECNSFKNPDAEFRKYGLKIFDLTISSAVRLFLGFIMPELNNILKVRLFPNDVTEFFTKAFKNVVDERIATNSKRNDFVQLLLDVNVGHGRETAPLSVNQMLAQSFLFFLAGFGTTANILTYCLYELALQPDIQQRVRDEIFEVLMNNDGNLTYDAIMGMKYMDQIVDETLRKYPSVPIITRKCTKAYTIPGTDVVIERDTSVFINVRAIQRDEEYFPNPEAFDPERFSKENKAKMHPYTFLPFGDGPRFCIGRRFAIMQIKTGLTLLLRKFKVVPHETTPNPVKFSRINIVSWIPEKPILLNTEFYNESQ